MFNSILLDPNDSIISDRLSRIQSKISNLKLATKEAYIVNISSLVNSVLNLGDNMQKLHIITPHPAVIGDLTTNFRQLNEDSSDIVTELLRIEDNLAVLYNVAATNQNSLRQALRETIYSNSVSSYTEPFISKDNISNSSTINIDLNAGIAQLPLISEKLLTPTISLGNSCVGGGTGEISSLINATIGFQYIWTGNLCEMVLTFSEPTIINRVYLGINTYEGLSITGLTSSPDGILYNDILKNLPDTVSSNYFIGVSSGKYSGDVIIDFAPVYAKNLKIDITNFSSNKVFSLNSIKIVNRTYQETALLLSKQITLDGTDLNFSTSEIDNSPYCQITHQLSNNGVNFKNINPGKLTGAITSGSPFYYRSLLTRSVNAFINSTSALSDSDPAYTLKSQSVTSLGSGIVEQTIILTDIPVDTLVTLSQTPILNTFKIQVGTSYLTSGFNLTENYLVFTSAQSMVTITYQVSSYDSVQTLQNYYTPLLYKVNFEVI